MSQYHHLLPYHPLQDLEHNKKNDVNGVIIESWIVEDSMIDKSVLYGLKNVPVGTWMISVKVEDKQFWDEYVKTNKVRGFSIEGAFGQELVEMMANRQELVDPKSGETQDEFIGRCVGVHVNEGYDASQAAAICYSKWDNAKMSEEFRRGDKISFDFDGTLSTILGKEMARRQIKSGSTVYIISARDSKDGMLATADMLNISHDRVFATGSNEAKVAKVKELGIDKHFDNNNDVVRKLPKIGVSFSLTEDEALELIENILKQN